MSKDFARSVREAADGFNSSATAWVVNTTARLGGRIIDVSPVDTGQFKGGWHATIGAPERKLLNRLDPTGLVALGDILNTIREAGAGRVVYIQEDEPYAIPLEDGHSKQAPNGILAITAQLGPHYAQQEAERLGMTTK